MAQQRTRGSRRVLAAAVLVAAATFSGKAFTGLQRPATYDPFRTASLGVPPRTLRFGLFEDFGNNLKEMASQATVGASAEETEEIIAKCKTGSIDLDDWVKLMSMLNKAGGAEGAVSTIGKMTGMTPGAGSEEESKETAKKLGNFEDIISFMTPEERKQPELLFGHAAAARAAVQKLAEKSARTIDEIDRFLVEFGMFRAMFRKLGEGKDMQDVAKEIQLEKKKMETDALTRKARRSKEAADPKLKKANKKQAEWLTL